MNDDERLVIAREQLDRILAFFPRVDSKASVVLGVITGMLAFLAANLTPLSFFYTPWGKAAVTSGTISVILMSVSLLYLYLQVKPSLAGPANSLLYFRSIASLKSDEFRTRLEARPKRDWLADFSEQIWRNSEILTTKFSNVEIALRVLTFAIPPWFFSLMILVVENSVRHGPG